MLAIPRDIRMSATWIDHQAQRALTFQIRDAMNDFLRQLHDVDTAMPGTVQELEKQLGVRIVVADRSDPEDRATLNGTTCGSA